MSTSRSLETSKSGRNEKNLGVLSKQYSSRDLPSHLKLKYRQSGQGTNDDLKNKDFKKELLERERIAFQEKESSKRSSQSNRSQAALPSSKKQRTESNIDADDPIRDEDEDDDSSDSDEDDTEALLAELNRIKKERAQEEARREAEKKVQEEKIRMENILSGNPLLNSAKTDFKVKRRWDDDVVFKNCAKNDFDEKEKPFINDTLRSQFHKKFMEKYIK
ncbi:spliceosome-associated protein CWC15-like protein [Leptotrombidium deliense]|uniref:Spliceosome-associated protein CWC15-like protein n=1 Tax=Leptotrombidium deliense TaxID=299467 RepID=A0A443SGA5_9ACAR|nr:spliceosome-associated protein CWC15-like protein [Leptotrombidium deliense]